MDVLQAQVFSGHCRVILSLVFSNRQLTLALNLLVWMAEGAKYWNAWTAMESQPGHMEPAHHLWCELGTVLVTVAVSSSIDNFLEKDVRDSLACNFCGLLPPTEERKRFQAQVAKSLEACLRPTSDLTTPVSAAADDASSNKGDTTVADVSPVSALPDAAAAIFHDLPDFEELAKEQPVPVSSGTSTVAALHEFLGPSREGPPSLSLISPPRSLRSDSSHSRSYTRADPKSRPRVLFDAMTAELCVSDANQAWTDICGSPPDLMRWMGVEAADQFAEWLQPILARAMEGHWSAEKSCYKRSRSVQFSGQSPGVIHEATVVVSVPDPLLAFCDCEMAYHVSLTLVRVRTRRNPHLLMETLQE